MFKNIFNFLKHPIIYTYNAGVNFLEKASDKRIRKELKNMSNIDSRLAQYHKEGFTNRDILKHIKKRKKANKMNAKAGNPLPKLSLLPSLNVVNIEKQEEQIEDRKNINIVIEVAGENVKKSINTIVKRVKDSGIDKELLGKFSSVVNSSNASRITDFYKRNKDEFESIFIKYLGSVDDIEEAILSWLRELNSVVYNNERERLRK